MGVEEDGKGELFSRPVVVIRKFSKQMFWGVPLSTTRKRGEFYLVFKLKGKTSVALLSQARVFDAGRMTANKLGMVTEKDFRRITKRLIAVLFTYSGVSPEGRSRRNL